jgi:hypothetical protein
MSGSALANAANGLVRPSGGFQTLGSYAPSRGSLAVPPAAPVRPIHLPPAHTWRPIPPVAFHIPKEPAQRSSRGSTAKAVARVAVPKARLKSSYGRMQR